MLLVAVLTGTTNLLIELGIGMVIALPVLPSKT
jgi:hypothetical protein